MPSTHLSSDCPHSDCLVPPSVLDELAYLCDFGQTERVRRSAQEAMKQLRRERRFRSLLEPPFDPAQAERLASEFRHRGLLPQFEVHDSRILAEATLLACAILVTSDAHLRAIDHERLTLLLHPHELAPPVIATPRARELPFMTRAASRQSILMHICRCIHLGSVPYSPPKE